jgi:hypothetical protein
LEAAEGPSMNRTIDNVLGDHAQYQAFIATLRSALSAHDAKAVAGLVSYPITVVIQGKRTKIASPASFVPNYDAIVTPQIAQAVIKQKYDDMLVNSQGIMFGDGQVWINGICKSTACSTFDVKVITIQSAATYKKS